MSGKTVVITGASRGLGYTTALALGKKGASLVVLNRPSARADSAVAEIERASTGRVSSVPCDLCDFASVRSAAHAVRGLVPDGIDVLCLNAGIMMQPDEPSNDGYDITIAANVLSHFLLTKELMEDVERAAAARGEARIVSMSSGSGFGGPSFDARYFAAQGGSLGGPQASYERYHQSKLANLLFTSALHAKLTARRSAVKALACTPGVCSTDMFVHVQRSMGREPDLGMVQSVEDGCLAQLLCASDPSLRSGELWGPAGIGGLPTKLPLGPPAVLVDEPSKEQLWRACEQAVGSFELD